MYKIQKNKYMDKNKQNTDTRFEGIDFLKTICAFLVITIHFPFPGEFGRWTTALARIAVPIFFMITGFFFNDKKSRKQVKKILILIISSNIIYAVFDLIMVILLDGIEGYLSFSTIKNWLISKTDLYAIMKLLLFNVSPFGGHLWYLNAILYVLLIASFMTKRRKDWILYFFVPILLIGDLVLGKYSLLLFGKEFPYILVRNFLFVGLPYFYIGFFINRWNICIRKEIAAVGIVIFSITTILERNFLVCNGVNAAREHYISTTFAAVLVFCLFKDYKYNLSSSKILKYITNLGRNYAIGIYIFHPMIGRIMKTIIQLADPAPNRVLTCIHICFPLIVFGITLFVYALIVKVKSKRFSALKSSL